ncbi:MAG: ABC transporter ATP-binding protein [Bacilli bacterium]|nr:ABC transporter ATP-binding protein [Bacilli bacterium]
MYKAVRREVEHEKKIAALAAKGQEEPPLTTKQRAKLPEKQLSSEEALEMLRPLFQTFIHHLSALIEQYFDLGEYSERFYRYYKNTLYLSHKKVSQNEAKEEALEIMRQVGIPQPEIRFYQYPFEFSGGMRQRIVIAIALSSRPEVLICDEPTTALDVTIQAQILELINKLKEELDLSIIFITHDLGVVANMADDIAVMYAGKIVEYGTVDDIFYDPRHPYTWALLASMPDLETKHKLDAIPGTPPNMVLPPIGDAFAARNKYALAIDFEEQPPLFQISETHAAATWLLAPDAPKATPPEIVRARIDRAMEKRNAAKRKEKA